MTPSDLRQLCRTGKWNSTTAGVCDGYVQCNVVALPQAYAADFARFCAQNPRPCPVIGQSNPGETSISALGGFDIRTDCPKYQLFVDGNPTDELQDMGDYWQQDWVFFAIGCSFSFEDALLETGIPLRHIQQNRNVAMYNTNIACHSAGPFGGNMVVSMRPLSVAHTIRAIQICSRFPAVHGAPIHFGNPQDIGIDDIDKPDYGDKIDILDSEIPVFWACGVTPQQALRAAKLPIAITHAPGHMLVTDLRNAALAAL
ncbi:MAG: putative hydro-lyase [Halieaceae bacterium]|nr:putative hydro-lyase [Halieaceae bacterium]